MYGKEQESENKKTPQSYTTYRVAECFGIIRAHEATARYEGDARTRREMTTHRSVCQQSMA